MDRAFPPVPSRQPALPSYTVTGGEKSPVTFPAFKAGDSVLRGSNGGFDYHTPPPHLSRNLQKNESKKGSNKGGVWGTLTLPHLFCASKRFCRGGSLGLS